MVISERTATALSEYLDAGRFAETLADFDETDRELFGTYANEALFFLNVLDADIRALKPGATVVEIGSGIGLLARLIAAQGHEVLAFEPESAGFGSMRRLSDLIEANWQDTASTVTEIPGVFDERVLGGRSADLLIAVNVIEHVSDPAFLVETATRTLSPGGHARFICPNYAFPYEPHFNIPTALSKALTYRLARRAIRRSRIDNAEDFWTDLSWPTQRGMHSALRAASVSHEFSRGALCAYVGRLSDEAFVARKGRLFGLAARSAGPLLARVGRYVPLSVSPIIDLTTRRSHSLSKVPFAPLAE